MPANEGGTYESRIQDPDVGTYEVLGLMNWCRGTVATLGPPLLSYLGAFRYIIRPLRYIYAPVR